MDPSEQPADPDPADSVQRLCHARDLVEAGLICARLDTEGIRAVVQESPSYQVLWHMQSAMHPLGLPILVRTADLERARAVLDDVRRQREQAEPELEAVKESPAEQHVRMGYRASIIFFLSVIGVPMVFLAMRWLYKGRAAWNDPDPAVRRKCRRQLIIGWTMCILMLPIAVWFVQTLLDLLYWDVVRGFLPAPWNDLT